MRCFVLAAESRKLAVSTVALVLTGLGWQFFAWLFFEGSHGTWTDAYSLWPWQAADPLTITSPAGTFPVAYEPISTTWLLLSRPFRRLFVLPENLSELAFALTASLWALLVWSVAGGMLCRLAALQLGREDRSSLSSALGHVWSKWRAYLVAPLFPLVGGVLILLVPMFLCGLALRGDVGVLLAGIFWPVQLALAVLMALLVAGVLLGWPLMWSALAAEESDSFDALSRSFSSVYHRPLHFLGMTLLAMLLGIVAWNIVMLFGSLVAYLSLWSAGLGAGAARIDDILPVAPALRDFAGLPPLNPMSTVSSPEQLDPSGRFGAELLGFWLHVIYAVAWSYGASFFWTSAVAIYLVLRLELEGTELDDIHVEEEEYPETLPSLAEENRSLPIVEFPGGKNEPIGKPDPASKSDPASGAKPTAGPASGPASETPAPQNSSPTSPPENPS